MLLTVELLDQKTLDWRVLAHHEDVAADAVPTIIGTIREGLPPTSVLRWNWSGRRGPAVQSAGPARARGRVRKRR
jgi:hypothetical protein